jgi:hypothetical protein
MFWALQLSSGAAVRREGLATHGLTNIDMIRLQHHILYSNISRLSMYRNTRDECLLAILNAAPPSVSPCTRVGSAPFGGRSTGDAASVRHRFALAALEESEFLRILLFVRGLSCRGTYSRMPTSHGLRWAVWRIFCFLLLNLLFHASAECFLTSGSTMFFCILVWQARDSRLGLAGKLELPELHGGTLGVFFGFFWFFFFFWGKDTF